MRRLFLLLLPILVSASRADGIPSPKEFLGHDVCEDYWLANYRQLTAYWNELDKRSDRLTVQSIGKTEDGREQLMCVITDPANRRNLENYRKGSERLARARGFKSDDEARAFARKQKAVIWIDGGLHANEVLVAQQLIETAYRLTSQNDPETRRILKDCIILLAHANPDGQDWVADWYMRREDPKTRSVAGLPYLYQKYCGHDNNRDFYANNMAETRNINRILYSVWYPQIVYNHHQSAPAGTIMFVPPFRNPFNYHFDPMTQIGTDLVGTHMHQRMIGEGKPGTAMRGSTLYSTWWNGGLRTTTYFHNMIGILTETWGSPNPGPLPFTARFQVPTTDVPFPVEAGKVWHLRDSLEYEISANYAILDYASRYRERLLFDIYRAGRNSIERGSRDNWTRYPSRLAAHGAEALKKPELRDARMYVIPSDQPDFPTACKFVEKLMQCGVEVERLVSPLPSPMGRWLGGGVWPAGSFVVRCDQAFRPHILDMFEPQDHPNDFQYPGGPPIPPYDNAGYTLAYQMGVRFYRVMEVVPVRTERVSAVPRRAEFGDRSNSAWVSLTGSELDGFRSVNLALRAGLKCEDFRHSRTIGAARVPLGAFILFGDTKAFMESAPPGSAYHSGFVCLTGSEEYLKAIEDHAAVVATHNSQQPWPATPFALERVGATPRQVIKPRVALWDRYGGSMESGWTRYVLEQFAFDFDVVYPPDLDRGDLNDKYDCIIFPSGAVPGAGGGRGGAPAGGNTGPGGEAGGDVSELITPPPSPLPTTRTIRGEGEFGQGGGGQQSLTDDATIPYIYRRRMGSVSSKTMVELRKFVEKGGHLLCIGSSALNAARQLNLPVESALVDDKGANLPNTKFFIPGSVLRMKLNPGPLTLGMEESVDAMFDNSPAFRITPPPAPSPPGSGEGVQTVAFFDTDKPLRSGWAWGQEVLKDKAAVVDVPLGKGRVVLYGPEILFRGQSHGTFKLLFNAIFRSAQK